MITQFLVARLRANANLATFVGDRIYLVALPQNFEEVRYPSITFLEIPGKEPRGDDYRHGALGTEPLAEWRRRFRVKVHGTTALSVYEVEEAVYSSLVGWQEAGTDPRITALYWIGNKDGYQPGVNKGEGEYQRSLEFEVHHTRKAL